MAVRQELPGQIEPLTDAGRLTTPLWFAWFTFLRDTLTTFLGAWKTTFTPVAVSSAGGPPTVATTCRYVQNGRTVSVQLTANITALNGATGGLFLSLPVTPAARAAVLMGCEAFANGKIIRGSIAANGASVGVAYYDNTTALIAGTVLVLNGTYEV
jgi:hypothetical protein